jgi:hypothetical protein
MIRIDVINIVTVSEGSYSSEISQEGMIEQGQTKELIIQLEEDKITIIPEFPLGLLLSLLIISPLIIIIIRKNIEK